MGVPALFRWLSKKYPKIVERVVEDEPITVPDAAGQDILLPVDISNPNPNGFEVDNLYLDMNGIVHPCTHPEGKPPPETEQDMMLEIFAYTERVVNMTRPRKLLFMAIDGVAPRAKMNQQRSRRFRAVQEAQEKEQERAEGIAMFEAMGHTVSEETRNKKSWDSNAITPGTPFMDLLAASLRYWVVQKMNNDPGWKDIQVIISDASVPGEGEHKIMDFIRRQRVNKDHNPNTQHVIYGLDADLIMLALATHEPYFRVLREDVFAQDSNSRACRICGEEGHFAAQCTGKKQPEFDIAGEKPVVKKEKPVEKKPFIFLDVSVLREYLEIELAIPHAPFAFNLEQALDDWVFLIFFVGNDFLPHLPSLEIREGAIDTLLKIWKDELPRMGGYLTNHGHVELERAQVILEGLAHREDEIFRKRRESEERQDQNAKRRKIEESRAAERHVRPASGAGGMQIEGTPYVPVLPSNLPVDPPIHHSLPRRPQFDILTGPVDTTAIATPVQQVESAKVLGGSNADVVNNRRAIRMANMNAAEHLKAELAGLVPLGRNAPKRGSAVEPLPPPPAPVPTPVQVPVVPEVPIQPAVSTPVETKNPLPMTFTPDMQALIDSVLKSVSPPLPTPNALIPESAPNPGSDAVLEVASQGLNGVSATEVTLSTNGPADASAPATTPTVIESADDTEMLNGDVDESFDSARGIKRKADDLEEPSVGDDTTEITFDSVEADPNSDQTGVSSTRTVNPDGTVEYEDTVRLWEPGYKERYYRQKFGVELSDVEFRKSLTKSYLEGLAWVLHYYYQGTPSWQWYYPHHYAPFASDFENVSQMEIKFELGQPFKPFEQLMGVFPAASRVHLPEPFQRLMIEDDSPILDFYPESFEIDMNGKKMAWQGVALLPFIDPKRLLAAMAVRYPELSEDEVRRNKWGTNVIMTSDQSPLYDYYCGLYTKKRIKQPILIDTKLSSGLAGSVLADPTCIPGSTYLSPLIAQDQPDIHNDRSLSALYFYPKQVIPHKSQLLPGVRKARPTLTAQDQEFIRRGGQRGRGRGGGGGGGGDRGGGAWSASGGYSSGGGGGEYGGGGGYGGGGYSSYQGQGDQRGGGGGGYGYDSSRSSYSNGGGGGSYGGNGGGGGGGYNSRPPSSNSNASGYGRGGATSSSSGYGGYGAYGGGGGGAGGYGGGGSSGGGGYGGSGGGSGYNSQSTYGGGSNSHTGGRGGPPGTRAFTNVYRGNNASSRGGTRGRGQW